MARLGVGGRVENVPEPPLKSLAEHPAPPLVTGLVILCLSAGCGIVMIGDPVQKLDLSSEDNAEENLKAVRGILADQEKRKRPSDDRPYDLSSGAPSASGVPAVSESIVIPNPGHSSPSMVTKRIDAQAIIPWSPSPLERPHAPDRPVPAYTTPAPGGPDYSGSIRCAPDGLGGQRCVGR